MKNTKNEILLTVAWVVAIVATLGSLYFSEVRQFVPCTLCWYQRILMYPMSIMFGIAVYKRDFGIMKYSLALSVIGGSISAYHILLQNFPKLFHDSCTTGVPCSGKYINWFGFISIPVLAFTAFVVIAAISIFMIRNPVSEDRENINS